MAAENTAKKYSKYTGNSKKMLTERQLGFIFIMEYIMKIKMTCRQSKMMEFASFFIIRTKTLDIKAFQVISR